MARLSASHAAWRMPRQPILTIPGARLPDADTQDRRAADQMQQTAATRRREGSAYGVRRRCGGDQFRLYDIGDAHNYSRESPPTTPHVQDAVTRYPVGAMRPWASTSVQWSEKRTAAAADRIVVEMARRRRRHVNARAACGHYVESRYQVRLPNALILIRDARRFLCCIAGENAAVSGTSPRALHGCGDVSRKGSIGSPSAKAIWFLPSIVACDGRRGEVQIRSTSDTRRRFRCRACADGRRPRYSPRHRSARAVRCL